MKPLVYIFSTSLVICAISGCSPRPGDSGDAAQANESPAASLTAEEAAAYAGYSPNLAGDESAGLSSEGAQSQ
jgi:hypothetical protein